MSAAEYATGLTTLRRNNHHAAPNTTLTPPSTAIH